MQEFKKYISSLKFKGTAQLRQHKVSLLDTVSFQIGFFKSPLKKEKFYRNGSSGVIDY